MGTRTVEICYYENVGTLAFAEFELKNTLLGGIDVSTSLSPDAYAAPHFFRDSGEVHLFIGSVSGDLIYYDSIDNNFMPGDTFNLVSNNYLGINVESYSSFWVNDIDSDNRLNLFVGQDLGGLYHFESDPNSDAGINDVDLSVLVSIYPNPMTDHLTIASELDLDYFTLYDAKGKLINKEKIISNKTTINTHDLIAGFYYVAISLKDGRQVAKKVIK